MKHTTFFLLLLFCIFDVNATAEQIRSKNIPQPYENSEIINNVNTSIDRLDTAISHLTSQIEEGIHAQKQSQNTTTNSIKDIKLQIKNLQETQEKLSREIAIQKIEMENLKNLTSMYTETVKKLENTSPTQQTTINKKTILKPENIKIDQTIIAEDTNTIKNEEKTILSTTKNAPSELLLPSSTQEEIETETNTKDNPHQYTDEETFNMALETYKSKNYTDSAIQFAANIKAFPNGKNFYKNLFYLGLSMQNINNKIGACTAFAKIIHSKEKIDSSIKTQAEQEFNSLKCNTSQTSSTTKK